MELFSKVGKHFAVILLFYTGDLEWRFACPTAQKATNHFNKFIFNRKPAVVEGACLISAGRQVGLGHSHFQRLFVSYFRKNSLSRCKSSIYPPDNSSQASERCSRPELLRPRLGVCEKVCELLNSAAVKVNKSQTNSAKSTNISSSEPSDQWSDCRLTATLQPVQSAAL